MYSKCKSNISEFNSIFCVQLFVANRCIISKTMHSQQIVIAKWSLPILSPTQFNSDPHSHIISFFSMLICMYIVTQLGLMNKVGKELALGRRYFLWVFSHFSLNMVIDCKTHILPNNLSVFGPIPSAPAALMISFTILAENCMISYKIWLL